MLEGRLTYQGDGMSIALRAMNATVHRMEIHTDNIAHFGLPGYQRKTPVITSFVEHLGKNAIDTVTSTEIGRLRKSDNPLDFALNSKGYFQYLNAGGGIEMTRDGRMKLDKDGYLLALDGRHVLSDAGLPVRFSHIPKDLNKHVTVAPDGEIKVFNTEKNAMQSMGRLSVVNQDGSVVDNADVKQGYVEDSNVFLQREFVSVVPLRRNFEANRQLFIIQSDTLSRTIQELGRPQ